MLLRRIATLLAVVLIAIAFLGVLGTLASSIMDPAFAVTILIGLVFLGVFIGKGYTGARSTTTPYW